MVYPERAILLVITTKLVSFGSLVYQARAQQSVFISIAVVMIISVLGQSATFFEHGA